MFREVIFNNVTKREGNKITYVKNTKYYFDRDRSCKNCDPIIDKITTINYPLLVSKCYIIRNNISTNIN